MAHNNEIFKGIRKEKEIFNFDNFLRCPDYIIQFQFMEVFIKCSEYYISTQASVSHGKGAGLSSNLYHKQAQMFAVINVLKSVLGICRMKFAC